MLDSVLWIAGKQIILDWNQTTWCLTLLNMILSSWASFYYTIQCQWCVAQYVQQIQREIMLDMYTCIFRFSYGGDSRTWYKQLLFVAGNDVDIACYYRATSGEFKSALGGKRLKRDNKRDRQTRGHYHTFSFLIKRMPS